jgi:hypothetical protein
MQPSTRAAGADVVSTVLRKSWFVGPRDSMINMSWFMGVTLPTGARSSSKTAVTVQEATDSSNLTSPTHTTVAEPHLKEANTLYSKWQPKSSNYSLAEGENTRLKGMRCVYGTHTFSRSASVHSPTVIQRICFFQVRLRRRSMCNRGVKRINIAVARDAVCSSQSLLLRGSNSIYAVRQCVTSGIAVYKQRLGTWMANLLRLQPCSPYKRSGIIPN